MFPASFAPQSLRRATARGYLETLHHMLPNPLLVVSPEGWLIDANPAAIRFITGHEGGRLPKQVVSFWPDFDVTVGSGAVNLGEPTEVRWSTAEGDKTVLATLARQKQGDDVLAYVCVASDLTERKKLEVELRAAQKLESLGQLAAGVAHEINTPMQFIGDNVRFVRDVLQDVMPLLVWCAGPDAPEEIQRRAQEVDLDFALARSPMAVDKALEGVARVADIVSAMRSFAHPSNARTHQDLNHVIQTSLALAKHEYKFVAAVTTDLDELPAILGNLPELSQMFVNLLVNAAHAIEERYGRDPLAGHIAISTKSLGDRVRVELKDNGCGIPEGNRHKIFDPFFTTKGVGRGTGQGLAIVHHVVQRHEGRLTVESEVNRGTNFVIEFPSEAPQSSPTLRVSLTAGSKLW